MKMFKKKDGFTLVELIVVIAILAILAGVAIPAYSGYIEKANDASVITELDAIQTAVQGANATAGSITKINLSADGKEITVTANPATLAETFATDFNTYYGGTFKSGTTYTLTKAVSLTGTSYASGATWHAGDPDASGNLKAGWNAGIN